MGFKIFIDINIFIDLLDNERFHHLDAVNLFNEAEAEKCYSFVTESVLNTTSYIIRKDYSIPKVKELFSHLLSFCKLIPVDNFVCEAGLQRTVNDVEDAILYTAALQAKMDYFVTNDKKDLKRIEVPSLPVLSAKDFLTLV